MEWIRITNGPKETTPTFPTLYKKKKGRGGGGAKRIQERHLKKGLRKKKMKEEVAMNLCAYTFWSSELLPVKNKLQPYRFGVIITKREK